MKNTYNLSIVLLTAMGASAQDTATNSYTQTNLVSDIADGDIHGPAPG